jgi:Flp pilus assembly protein TadD
VYRLIEPLQLPKGSMISMEITYDNSLENRNPRNPPQRTVWGQRTDQEMGDLWIQFLAAPGSDRAIFNEALRQKMLSEDVIGLEAQLRDTPGDVVLHNAVGRRYLDLKRFDDAIRHFEAVAAVQRDTSDALVNLGTALAEAGREEQALTLLRQAVEQDPTSVAARNRLATTLLATGAIGDAVGQFARGRSQRFLERRRIQ